MRRKYTLAFVSFIVLIGGSAFAQHQVDDQYLIIDANGNDPLFTTYAAAMERSRYHADKAYFMDYHTPDKPITYSSHYAGDLAVIWKINNVVISKKSQFAKPPVVTASFPDMALLEYEPLAGLKVRETFFVYSSGAALVDLQVTNEGDVELEGSVYGVLHLPQDSLKIVEFSPRKKGYVFTHYEPRERLHSNLYPQRGYPTDFRNMLVSKPAPDSYGGYPGGSIHDFYFAAKRMSKVHDWVKELNRNEKGEADMVALQVNIRLAPGASTRARFVRGVQDAAEPLGALAKEVKGVLSVDVDRYVSANVRLFESIPRIEFSDHGDKLVYLGAFNLVRQCMMPPWKEAKQNYYHFSRNPTWGWGHGHQVMHESISMLSYVYLDEKSAQESQRVYMEQQFDDGFIAYRHGPWGPQTYPHDGKPTTSAPFFSWTNWSIYEVSRDKDFLEDAYNAGARYIRLLEKERDKDQDGMYEWGPYGIIENVRDGWNAVFQLFSDGKDEGRDISHELDALDLTTQVANEMYYLQLMAKELNDEAGAQEWGDKFARTAKLINDHMWDDEDSFYYHVSMYDDSFKFEGESLKRKEIIGFLPMWAHVASTEQAAELVKHLTNTSTFWRQYGVPTLAADDPVYTSFVDGCCRWNGPIWLLWDYMVLVGLQNYGYDQLAMELAGKMMEAVKIQLVNNHCFWESFSPDYTVLECPSNYIWDSIMARVLIDIYDYGAGAKKSR
ncbi:MAG: hypothetical protein KAU50_11795 [Candidatus Marinimicrobia bacterium]|nr:hypothetical protein [Candidatus Neomarinimicrobiota bacterium]